jgi:hypothetical protein
VREVMADAERSLVVGRVDNVKHDEEGVSKRGGEDVLAGVLIPTLGRAAEMPILIMSSKYLAFKD